MSQLIVTAFTGCADCDIHSNTQDTQPHLTTLNVQFVYTCEASIDGIDCRAQATQQYTISTTGVTRRLCDVHFRMLLRMVRLWHWRRVMTYVDEQEQKARGAA